MSELLERVKETYRHAKSCGKEGKGTHRTAGSSGMVHNLWMEAVIDAELAGLDWKKAMQEVRDE